MQHSLVAQRCNGTREETLKHSAIQWLNLCEGKRPYFGESSNDLAELISVCFGIYTQTAIPYFNEFVKAM